MASLLQMKRKVSAAYALPILLLMLVAHAEHSHAAECSDSYAECAVAADAVSDGATHDAGAQFIQSRTNQVKVETEVEAPCAYGKITAVGHGNAPVGSCCPGPNRNQGTCSNSHPLMYGKTQSVCWTVLGDNWGYCEVEVVSSSDVSPIGTGCCGVKGASPTPEGQHFTRYLGGGGGTSLATCKAKCNKDPECVAMDNGKSGCNIYITNNARTGLNNFVSTDSSTNWLKGNPATGTLSLGNVQASPGKWCVNNNFKCYAKAPLPTKTGVGCCDWHYKDVSGTATSLAACAQDCEKEANCEQFSYGKVAGAPSCRISKCGSYPGGTPCPDDEQCPITRTHPACMASNTYTIHDPCAAKCGPTCKGPDDASRPECTVCAQCHAMFVQADVEQTSQEARHTEFDRKTKGTTNI